MPPKPPWKSSAALEGAALDHAALADLDRDRGLRCPWSSSWRIPGNRSARGEPGGLRPSAAHAEAAHGHRHVAGGLDAPHLEQGRGVLGGQW